MPYNLQYFILHFQKERKLIGVLQQKKRVLLSPLRTRELFSTVIRNFFVDTPIVRIKQKDIFQFDKKKKKNDSSC